MQDPIGAPTPEKHVATNTPPKRTLKEQLIPKLNPTNANTHNH